eukprot:6187426-Pleurochrysis_carterae.AAC.3
MLLTHLVRSFSHSGRHLTLRPRWDRPWFAERSTCALPGLEAEWPLATPRAARVLMEVCSHQHARPPFHE